MEGICILKFAKGHNSVKNIGGVMVLALPILSDNTLYLFQVLLSISLGFKFTDLNSRVDDRVVDYVEDYVDARTYQWMDVTK